MEFCDQLKNAKHSNIKLFLLVLFLATFLVLPWIFSKPFYSKGEPREALVARQMLETGNWILPHRYGDDIATKPPMSHWLMALASLPFGKVSPGSARFPIAFLSILVCASLYLFLSKYFSTELAVCASLILLSSVEWHRSSLACRVDLPLSVFFFFGLLGGYLWFNNRSFKWFWLTAFGLTFATLSKGPVAIVLPSAIFGIYQLFNGVNFFKASLRVLQVIVLPILLASLWYLSAYQLAGNDFLDIVISENFGRFTGTMKQGVDPHTHSVFYLYGTLIVGFLPFSLVLIVSLMRHLPKIKRLRNFRVRLADYKSLPDFIRFCLIVAVVTIFFFSIPDSKRGAYLLPAYPFLAVILAYLAVRWFYLLKNDFDIVAYFLGGLVFVMAILVSVVYFVEPGLWANILPAKKVYDLIFFAKYLSEFNLALLFSIWLPILVFILVRKRGTPKSLLGAGLIAYFSMLTVLNAIYFPAFAEKLSGKDLVIFLDNQLPEIETIYTLRDQEYSLAFYDNKNVVQYNGEFEPQNGELKELHGIASCEDTFNLEDVFGKIPVEVRPLSADCFILQKPKHLVKVVKVIKK